MKEGKIDNIKHEDLQEIIDMESNTDIEREYILYCPLCNKMHFVNKNTNKKCLKAIKEFYGRKE